MRVSSVATSKKNRQTLARRFLRIFSIALATLIITPLLLTLLYLFVNPISVPMLERYLTGRAVRQEWRSIDQISDRLKASVIMSEDGQFCRHLGVDMGALKDELENFLAGRETRGASTITMQLARNLFLTNSRNPLRKALEIPLAIYIDLVMPKRRIMEIYLNIAEWGPDGQFGIVAGTASAFAADPRTMTWDRAALMASALPNPLLRLPQSPSAGLARLAEVIANRARQYGQRANCVGANDQLSL